MGFIPWTRSGLKRSQPAALRMERWRRTTPAARKSRAARHRISTTPLCCLAPNAAARSTPSMPSAASSMTSRTTPASRTPRAMLALWRKELHNVYAGSPTRAISRALAENRPALPDSTPLFRGSDRRRRDGSFAHALCDLRRTRTLLPSRRFRRRSHLHRDFWLCESFRAHLCGTARPRLSANQHYSRRQRGRRPRPHLSAARRPGALRGYRGRNPARRLQFALPLA